MQLAIQHSTPLGFIDMYIDGLNRGRKNMIIRQKNKTKAYKKYTKAMLKAMKQVRRI